MDYLCIVHYINMYKYACVTRAVWRIHIPFWSSLFGWNAVTSYNMKWRQQKCSLIKTVLVSWSFKWTTTEHPVGQPNKELQNGCKCSKLPCPFVLYIQYYTIQYYAIQYNTIQYNTIQYNTIQYNTIQYNTVQYSTVQYSTVQYSTVQYSTIQYNTIQYNTIQYNNL